MRRVVDGGFSHHAVFLETNITPPPLIQRTAVVLLRHRYQTDHPSIAPAALLHEVYGPVVHCHYVWS